MADTFEIPKALEESCRQNLLSVARSKKEWKTFLLVNPEKDLLEPYWTTRSIRSRLAEILHKIAQAPVVIVEQFGNGAVICSLSFIRLLQAKGSRLSRGLKPAVYFVFYPREDLIFTTKSSLPDWARTVWLEFSGASNVHCLRLKGTDVPSLREVNMRKRSKGVIRWQAVPCKCILDGDSDMSEEENEMPGSIIDLDRERKAERDKQFRKHFDPKNDPKLQKICFNIQTPFGASNIVPNTRGLIIKTQVTFRSGNLSSFFEDCVQLGIFPEGVPPYLQNSFNYGQTEITLHHGQTSRG